MINLQELGNTAGNLWSINDKLKEIKADLKDLKEKSASNAEELAELRGMVKGTVESAKVAAEAAFDRKMGQWMQQQAEAQAQRDREEITRLRREAQAASSRPALPPQAD